MAWLLGRKRLLIMFGAPGKIANSAKGSSILVTQGNYLTFYGFYDDGFFSPANDIGSTSPTDIYGEHINGLYWADGGDDVSSNDTFIVYIDGNHPQTFFTTIDIESYGLLHSADADTYDYDSGGYGYTRWHWENLLRPHTIWDGTGDLAVTFY